MRAIGNRGEGAIAGHRVPVAGRVSMDLITLDVSDVPGVVAGANVEFFGDAITLEEIAAAAGTANYEILTGIGPRVPRHYLEAA
jgi:alanine racemase